MDLKPNRGNKNNEKKNFPRIVTIVIWALVLTLSLNYIFSLLRTANTEEISFTEFLTLVENDKVASVTRGEDSYIIKEKVDTSSPQSALRSSRTLYTGLVDYPDHCRTADHSGYYRTDQKNEMGGERA